MATQSLEAITLRDYYLHDFVVRDIKIALYLESPLEINFNLISGFLSK